MNRIVLPTILLTGALAVGSIGIRVASAEDTNYPPIVERLAERFGINKDEVHEVFQEFRDEHHAEMAANMAERLNDLVAEGKLTETQRDLLIAKHEEMQIAMDNARELDHDASREKMHKLHEDFRLWLRDNGIEPDLLGRFGKGMRREFKRG